MTSPSSRSDRTRLRIGVAGLGAVAQADHLPPIARRSDTFEIATICDLSRGLVAALGERYRVPARRRRLGITDGRTDIVTCHRAIARISAQRGLEIGGEAAEMAA
jgi:hypothetical protein